MELRLFGPVELSSDEVNLDIGSTKPRLILAALACQPGEVVPVDVLVDRVWGESAPGHPLATLYTYLSRLRQVLGSIGVAIGRRAGGYVCEVPRSCVDVVRFRDQVAEARRADDARAVGLLSEALNLWSGTPLCGLPGEWAARERDALEGERLSALVLLASHRDQRGDLSEMADVLVAAAAEYPLSEPLAGFQVRALAAAGRRAEALDRYARFRKRLRDELGEEPVSELRNLHVRLLRGDPTLIAGASTSFSRPGPVVPRQLPQVTRHFVGRQSELRALDQMLTTPAESSSVVISSIGGTAGIGKTALALHWAHRVAPRFPEGQLYVNLRGFDVSRAPVLPLDALRGFLEALGVAPHRVPQELEARAALFRSLVADRRMLVVLDNAREADQVRSLLPGTTSCLTMITSRNRLVGLVAQQGAHPFALDVLSEDEARQLLVRYMGRLRVEAEPDAVSDLLIGCGGLPLALAVVGARASLDPASPLASQAVELADLRRRVAALATDDPQTSVRAVFSWSYEALRPTAQRLFRLVGLSPGPDISTAAAASLAAVLPAEVREPLDELCRANLLTEHLPGRFTCHDLLRSYAAELGEADPEREVAVDRLLDHYLHTAQAAGQQLPPERNRLALPPTHPGVTPESMTSRDVASAWFAAEQAVLPAVVAHAGSAGRHVHAWQLGELMAEFFDQRGYWRERLPTDLAALASAREAGDPAAMALTHRRLAHVCTRLGRHDDATEHLNLAIELYGSVGDLAGQAKVHQVAAFLEGRRQDHRAALAHAEQALSLHRQTADLVSEGRALNQVAWYHAMLGQVDEALEQCQHALNVQQRCDDPKTLAAVWDTLGHVRDRLGEHDEARRCFARSVREWHAVGDPFHEADTLMHLATNEQAGGDLEAARRSLTQAWLILEDLDHPAVEDVRARLAELGSA